MIWLAAFAISSAAAPATPAGPVGARVEARATVRILSAAWLSFDGEKRAGVPRVSDGIIHTPEGKQPAKLIEFQ